MYDKGLTKALVEIDKQILNCKDILVQSIEVMWL